MSRKKKRLLKAAEETTHTAAERGAAALDQAVEFLAPYVATASEFVSHAKDAAAPLAQQAKSKSADLGKDARHVLEPAFNDALDKVSPAVDSAKQKVQDDLLPKLMDLLHEAEKHPAVKEATKRGTATLAAVKGEVEVKPKKRGIARTVAKVIAAGALLAGAAVAVRTFLVSKDDGWTAHDPAPTPSKPTSSSDSLLDDSGLASETEDARLVYSTESDVTSDDDPNKVLNNEGAPIYASEQEDAEVAETDSAASVAGYGEGSFVGAEPPEGYTIKGNERSKKFHLPESGGYERTIADVWFDSEESATAAGFTRAQR